MFLDELIDTDGNPASELVRALRGISTGVQNSDQLVDEALRRVTSYDVCSALAPVFDAFLSVLSSFSPRNRNEVLGAAANQACLLLDQGQGLDSGEALDPRARHFWTVIGQHLPEIASVAECSEPSSISAIELLACHPAATSLAWPALTKAFAAANFHDKLMLMAISNHLSSPPSEWIALLTQHLHHADPTVRFGAGCLLFGVDPAAQQALVETVSLAVPRDNLACNMLALKLKASEFDHAWKLLGDLLPRVPDGRVAILIAAAGLQSGERPKLPPPRITSDPRRVSIFWNPDALRRLSDSLDRTQRDLVKRILSTLPSLRSGRSGQLVDTNIGVALGN